MGALEIRRRALLQEAVRTKKDEDEASASFKSPHASEDQATHHHNRCVAADLRDGNTAEQHQLRSELSDLTPIQLQAEADDEDRHFSDHR